MENSTISHSVDVPSNWNVDVKENGTIVLIQPPDKSNAMIVFGATWWVLIGAMFSLIRLLLLKIGFNLQGSDPLSVSLNIFNALLAVIFGYWYWRQLVRYHTIHMELHVGLNHLEVHTRRSSQTETEVFTFSNAKFVVTFSDRNFEGVSMGYWDLFVDPVNSTGKIHLFRDRNPTPPASTELEQIVKILVEHTGWECNLNFSAYRRMWTVE